MPSMAPITPSNLFNSKPALSRLSTTLTSTWADCPLGRVTVTSRVLGSMLITRARRRASMLTLPAAGTQVKGRNQSGQLRIDNSRSGMDYNGGVSQVKQEKLTRVVLH